MALTVMGAAAAFAQSGALLPPQPTRAELNGVDVYLGWVDPNAAVHGYAIERRRRPQRPFETVAQLAAGTTSYRERVVRSRGAWYYRVRVEGLLGEPPGYSAEVRALLTPPRLRATLKAPLDVVAIADSSIAVQLSWTDTNTSEAGYAIERSLSGTEGFVEVARTASDATTYLDSAALLEATTYYYRVSAVASLSRSEYSLVVSQTTAGGVGGGSGLNVPLDVVAIADSSMTVQLSWTDTNTSESGYAIERSLSGTEGFVEIARTASDATTYLDSAGLLEATTYYYRVSAVASLTQSEYSLVVSQTTPGGGGGESGDATRRLGLEVNTATDGDYDRALQTARSAGVSFVPLSFEWDTLESAPGQFDGAAFLPVANLYYPANATAVALVLAPIDTTVDRRPADLRALRFDDPETILRFERLLDYVFAQIPQLELVSLAIGNEVDMFLSTAAAATEYRAFYEAVASYARGLRPGLPVGVKTTFDGLQGSQRAELLALNSTSDALLVTYYPHSSDGTDPDPMVASTDLAWLTDLTAKPVFLLEVGYPTSATLNGSDAKQASFVRNVFAAWDTAGYRMPLVSFARANDYTAEAASFYTSYYGYGMTYADFGEFVRTLGLCTEAGIEKAGFQALREESQARAF